MSRIRSISKRLRKERELSFYGAEDFVPTAEYELSDADQAIEEAGFVLEMDLILGVAERDECVRAVVMNGSRANPNAPRDASQDYDTVHLVTDLDSFVSDDGWIDVFGGAYCPAMQIALGEWK